MKNFNLDSTIGLLNAAKSLVVGQEGERSPPSTADRKYGHRTDTEFPPQGFEVRVNAGNQHGYCMGDGERGRNRTFNLLTFDQQPTNQWFQRFPKRFRGHK